jgi:hypothetical protein
MKGDRNEILRWARDLSVRDRAALNQKLDMLEKLDYKQAIQLKLLAGPIHRSYHILKLRATGDSAMRPLLCRGPQAPLREYTLLRGATERDSKLEPPNCLEKAIENRVHVAADHTKRVEHERA